MLHRNAVTAGFDPLRRTLLQASVGTLALAAGIAQGKAATRFDVTLDLPYAGFLLTGSGATPLASARLSATQTDATYRIVLEVKSFLADITYESQGDIDAHGLVPRQFSERRKVAFRSKTERQVSFDYTRDPAAVNSRVDGRLLVPARTQDRLSLMLHLMALSRSNDTLLRDGVDLDIPFAGTERVTASEWRVAGPEPVVADDKSAVRPSAGQGFRIVRVADSRNTFDVSFWLSALPDRIPLVLQFSEAGRSLRFVHER